uniref:ATP synthase complex subunit 8 n=1 Tax=Enhydris subtaeniata TaxID=445411 RepID=D5LY54_9SAUR|nr:ATPase8 [Enhydris subtaeniata]ADF35716.1 ATPase8 [Enhydris subtaeniata]UQK68852.1 ATP synthase F0 subunit 8 [Enhydris subtaeniata]UQK68856.1 ATP synthase F0 subunit 8 [Enhydris subtaeniata]UQK68858.1 ATP synthase F0 subunit 8 [Enhydris subtaeniata]
MPQLDTIHIFITFLWTWLTLCLITKKTNTFKIISNPKTTNPTKTNTTTNLPWT